MAKFEDELNNILRGKGVDPSPTAEEVTDPGLYEVPDLNPLSFYQLKVEIRTYTRKAAEDIENLYAATEALSAETYSQNERVSKLSRYVEDRCENIDRQIGNIWEALNGLEVRAYQPKSFWKNEANYVWLGLVALLVIAIVIGPVR